ncbi:MAG: hypothetical protein M1820_006970 [Bogoriella megaspora]|nr:MAG: hypothetical protein M1820_006970 [Bogoriella megaspora]
MPVSRRPSEKGTAVASPSSAPSQPDRIEDRLAQLEKLVRGLEGSLNSATAPNQPVGSQNDVSLVTSPSTEEKRTYNQTIPLERGFDRDASRSRPKINDRSITSFNGQLFVPTSFPLAPRQMATHEEGSPKKGQTVSQNHSDSNCFLPDPDEGSSLLNEYLNDFNSKIPLFHPKTIYCHVRDCYTGAANQVPLSWVLTYIVFGIAYRLRAMSLFVAPNDTSNGDWYLQKCLSALPDLLLQQPSLGLIQALLGVSVLLQSSKRSQRSALFVSTAMHMAQDLAYNEGDPDSGESLSRDTQELYVFWMAFFMSTASDLRTIRPITQRLADISVPLPSPSAPDWWASKFLVDDPLDWKVNVLALHASLAVVQAKILEELFSVSARRHSTDLITDKFQTMVSNLETWRRSKFPANLDAQNILDDMYRSDVAHAVILEASYFGTLYQLHAGHALGAFTQRQDVFSSDILRAVAGLISIDIYPDAQRLLMMAASILQGNMPVIWIAIHALIPALCMVLDCYEHWNGTSSTILQPRSIAASMQVYNNILEILESVTAQADDTDLALSIAVCRHLYAQVKGGD